MEKYTLVGVNGNAFAVMAYVVRAMELEKVAKRTIRAYTDKAMSGSYDDLLALSCEELDKLNEKYLDMDEDDHLWIDMDED